MLAMYFVDYEHQENYRKLVRKWPQADPSKTRSGSANTEYQAPIYIASIPMIFNKVGQFLLEEARNPVDWIWLYLMWKDEYKEEWENYSKYRDDDERHPDYEAWLDKKPYDLTGSMIHLGKLSLNLWNDSNEFNLTRAMGSFDMTNMNVMLCAIYVRNGFFKDTVI